MARDPHGMCTPPAPGTLDRQFVDDSIPGARPAQELEWLREFEKDIREATPENLSDVVFCALGELDSKRLGNKYGEPR